MSAHRVVRTPLPVDQIREMDELILAGIGGYETRAEFIEDAIRERIFELRYEDAGPASEIDATEAPRPQVDQTVTRVESQSAQAAALTLHETGLADPGPGAVLDEGIDTPDDEPLFGLHNRDYPALWALTFLARITRNGPVPVADFEEEISKEAWEFGEALVTLERTTGSKLTGLFPTNREKKEASEGAFRMFAVGDHRKKEDGIRTRGPLYQWRAARIAQVDGGLVVGVTSAGRSLASAVAGLTANAPHSQPYAEMFFNHLREHAVNDWWGFARVLTAVAEGRATRKELIEDFARAPYEWSENEVSTNSAGYVARAREWGLLEPKQVQGQYVLTDFGSELATTNDRGEQ